MHPLIHDWNRVDRPAPGAVMLDDVATTLEDLREYVTHTRTLLTGVDNVNVIELSRTLDRDVDEKTTAMRLRNGAHWRIHSRLYNHRLGMKTDEIKVEFVGDIGWIEWCTCRASSHGKKSYSHLWTIREYQGDPVIAAQSHSV